METLNRNFLSELPIRECILGANELSSFSHKTGLKFTDLDLRFPYHHIVYVDAETAKPVIHWKAIQKNNLREPSFVHCLDRIPFYNYDSFLFLTTVYTNEITENFDHLLKRYIDNCRGGYFDYWFKPAYGYLVYYFQLEQLYCMLSGKSRKDAAEFRHDWNLKKPAAKQTLRQLMVRNNLSLFELIEYRYLGKGQFVYSPNYYGAYILSELMDNVGIQKLPGHISWDDTMSSGL